MTDFILAGKIQYGGTNPQANLYQSPLDVTLSPTSILSEEAFGSITISMSAAVIQPTGIASTENFGAIDIVSGAIVLLPTSIDSTEQFGSIVILDGSDALTGELTATFRIYCALDGSIGYHQH